jgi:hypothetical protein
LEGESRHTAAEDELVKAMIIDRLLKQKS